jgi:hypothetical protein
MSLQLDRYLAARSTGTSVDEAARLAGFSNAGGAL